MRLLFLTCLLLLAPSISQADAPKPIVSIIIDDMGYRFDQDAQALLLPGAITFSILPDTPGAQRILDAASQSGNEVMLHLPMESSKSVHQSSPGLLTSDMNWITFVRTLQASLASVPGIVAVNNHQGSHLTADYERMQWLMRELSNYPGIAFIDSRTTHHTVALDVAREFGLAATRRDIFLDYAPGKIEGQFNELISKAKRNGSALAIAHPHEDTIKFLQRNMHRLDQHGIDLVPVSRLIAQRQQSRSVEGG